LRSTSGEHYVGLDHVRALAAFMVFTWHFTHAANGFPVPFEYVPGLFLLAPLDEGHTGVALFMVLSGYLFAKLLHGKQMDFRGFLWNRLLRLAPALVLMLVLYGVKVHLDGGSVARYALGLVRGVYYPALPNGAWSITVEAHFYLLLPLLLWLMRRYRYSLVLLLLAAVAMRYLLYLQRGEIQSIAYWTLIGRIDQFLLGIMAFQFRGQLARQHWRAAGALLALTLFYWYFDKLGGFYLNQGYPSRSAVWVVLFTIEGAAYGVLLGYYDNTYAPRNAGFSRLLGLAGTYSYSIYLLHVFVVFGMARFVHEKLMDLGNFYVALAWSAVAFACMMPLGYVCYRYVEEPFLKLRRRYTRQAPALAAGPAIA
jgi:peptidoglycan/LPS O-acetylase OafA/YrhL